jgi:hypothetical protein
MLARVRAAARRSPAYTPYVRWKYRLSSGARRSYFAGMYHRNIWGDSESRSGSGSSLANTQQLRGKLPILLSDLNVRSLLDMPCGDWAWMQHVDLSGIDSYIGGDVVPELIEGLLERHAAPGRAFVVLDALSSDLPSVDAVMVRDLLGHLDRAQVRRLVRNVKRSGAMWLLVTHYPDVDQNVEVGMGGWRPQNLTLAPYRWPEPQRLLWERPRDERPDKTLAVWSLAGLT